MREGSDLYSAPLAPFARNHEPLHLPNVTNKKNGPAHEHWRLTSYLQQFKKWVSGVTEVEPAAFGVTVRYLRVTGGKMVAFVLNTAHRLPPMSTQKLQQPSTISCSVPSCFSFSSSCLLILTSQSNFHQFFKAVEFANFSWILAHGPCGEILIISYPILRCYLIYD